MSILDIDPANPHPGSVLRAAATRCLRSHEVLGLNVNLVPKFALSSSTRVICIRRHPDTFTSRMALRGIWTSSRPRSTKSMEPSRYTVGPARKREVTARRAAPARTARPVWTRSSEEKRAKTAPTPSRTQSYGSSPREESSRRSTTPLPCTPGTRRSFSSGQTNRSPSHAHRSTGFGSRRSQLLPPSASSASA